jgi:hypothetical protein
VSPIQLAALIVARAAWGQDDGVRLDVVERRALDGCDFLFHGLVLAPVATRALRRADVHRVKYWSAVTAAVDASKLVWLMLALSSLITWGAISVAGMLGGQTAAAAESAINRLRYIRAGIVSLEQGGNLLLLGLASAALLFWIWRYNARRVAGVIEQVRMAQAEELFDKMKQGTLPELEPNDAMQKIGGIIGTLKARQEQVETAYAAAPNETEKKRPAAERARLASEEQNAFHAYVVNDIDRRIAVSPLEALEGDIPRPARSFSERFASARSGRASRPANSRQSPIASACIKISSAEPGASSRARHAAMMMFRTRA